MDFRMLGPLAASGPDGPIALGGPRQRTVLALLLVHANRVVTTDRLIDELYGEAPPDAARKSLQSYVANLRKAVNREGELLIGRAPGYVLQVDSSRIDAMVFERLVHQARRVLEENPMEARKQLVEALALWYGSPLVDVADEAPSLRQEVVKLSELRLAAIEDRIEAGLALGEHGTAAAELESLVVEHPLRERLWGQLMLALYRSGRQADALRAFQKARLLLGEELGIEPSPWLRELEDRILAQDPALEAPRPAVAAASPAPGRTIRGYELREQIGAGRLGTVYRAYQPAMGREVALKVVHPEIAGETEFARRFEQAAASIARLEHPHIVPFYDYWREAGGAYLVYRWLAGGNLGAAIETGPWSLDATARLVEQISSALAAAQRRGVCHGALASGNILLDAEQNAYLSDFPMLGVPAPDPGADACGLAQLACAALTGSQEPSVGANGAVAAEVRAVLSRALAAGFADSAAFVDAFLAAATPSTERSHRIAVPEAPNPYKGLRPFAEADAADFFGREALTEQLVERLGGTGVSSRFLAVVGASGSGKSSAVFAGLVPAIRSNAVAGSANWFVADMTPGSDPWHELGTALLGIAVAPAKNLRKELTADSQGLQRTVKRLLPERDAVLLLVIDQFEELFTVVDDEANRLAFLDALFAAVAATDSQLRAVVTLRADFYDRPLSHPGMSRLFTDCMETARPLEPEELTRAIAGPVARMGFQLEPGLEARIVADVANEPGALPLLQYTLTELFDGRRGNTLTLDRYRALHGVNGALARRAEELYQSLDREAQAAARQLLVRLVALGEGAGDARRRVLRSELAAIEAPRATLEEVLDRFGAQRLLSFDRDPTTRSPTVEVAHEALLREWPRLRRWIEEARADLGQERALRAAAAEWLASESDASYLLTGRRLDRFESWRANSQLALTRVQRDYLERSLRARNAAEAAEQERADREASTERRSRRRLRLLVAVLATAGVVSIVLMLVAQAQTRRAEHNLAIATARELTAESVRMLGVDAELGLLLALEAADIARDEGDEVFPETVEALHRALLGLRVVATVSGGGGGFSPDGSRLVTADPGTRLAGGVAEGGATVYSIRGEEVMVLGGAGGRTLEAHYSPDGTKIAAYGLGGSVHIWDAATGATLTTLEAEDVSLFAGAFSPDSRSFAVGGSDGLLRIINIATGSVRSIPVPDTVDVAFGPELLAVAADTAGTLVLDATTAEEVLRLPVESGAACRVEFGADGAVLAVADQDGVARLWDVATGERLLSLEGHAGPVCGVAFSPDGDRIATGGEDGTARLWDVTTGRELMVLAGHVGGIGSVAFDPTGRYVASAGGDGLTRIWDIAPAGSRELIAITTDGPATFSAYSPDGEWLATGAGTGEVAIWDVATGERRTLLPGHRDRISGGSFDPAGTLLVTSGEDATARVWDITTSRELFAVSAHSDTVWSSRFSPDGGTLATASLDGVVGLWDVPTGREISRFVGEAAFATEFSPDGSLLVAAGIGIRIWDVATATKLVDVPGHPGAILAVDFTPDGRRLVTAAADGTAKLWDLAAVTAGNLDELATLEGHTGAVLDVKVGPDGSRIATAGLDDSVRIWDPTGAELFAIPTATPGVVAFDPDGSQLAVPSGDGAVRIHVLLIDDLLTLADDRLTRSFTAVECERYASAPSCSEASAAS